MKKKLYDKSVIQQDEIKGPGFEVMTGDQIIEIGQKFLGICFKESLSVATWEGRKTQTRRIINLKGLTLADIQTDPDDPLFTYWKTDKRTDLPFDADYQVTIRMSELIKKARYKLGSFVYIKEPYYGGTAGLELVYKYDYDLDDHKRSLLDKKKLWNNKLFMPKHLARKWIKITGIRVEKLQDITRKDIIREGIENRVEGPDHLFGNYNITPAIRKLARAGGDIAKWAREAIEKTGPFGWYGYEDGDRRSFQSLINRINGKGTWEANPWVFVYDYQFTLINPMYMVPMTLNKSYKHP